MVETSDRQQVLIFEARQISKSFGPTTALDKVGLAVYRGEITGLIGENGSGKSTLSSIAAGMQPPSSGEMFFLGQRHKPATMIEGAKAGIGMIVQEMGTVSGISVAENIFIGEEDRFKLGLISSLIKRFCKEPHEVTSGRSSEEASGIRDIAIASAPDQVNGGITQG